MKGFRKLSGAYIALSDDTPHSDTFVEVALRPSIDHVFSDTWNTDPMNPAVCWRLKNDQELDDEKEAAAQKLLNTPLALKAFAQITWNASTELKTAYLTYAAYQTAIIQRYKALS